MVLTAEALSAFLWAAVHHGVAACGRSVRFLCIKLATSQHLDKISVSRVVLAREELSRFRKIPSFSSRKGEWGKWGLNCAGLLQPLQNEMSWRAYRLVSSDCLVVRCYLPGSLLPGRRGQTFRLKVQH